jgi:hypothetical protein
MATNEPDNEPVLTLQATFYFASGTSFEEAEREISSKLAGLDYTAVFSEITPESRAELMAEAGE